MKKVRITETELVSLIEKLVKENFAQGAANGNGHNFGLMGTPTAKYKEIFEKEDIEGEDELEEGNGEEEQLNVNVTDQPGSDDEDAWMESITEQENPGSCAEGIAKLIDDLNGMMDSDGNINYHQLVDELAKIAHGVNESRLISRLKRRLRLTEGDDWMQKVDKDIEKRGTEGVFHKWCVDHGYKDGCSKGCWDEAKKAGSPWSRRAGLAKAYCESSD
tara:strand:- start:2172 stop:2825 length:654 start_codon:yes stop_codon:yes gene_type:complete